MAKHKMPGHTKKMEKVHTVMSEFKAGTLRSGSGAKVKSRGQAIAIAMHESGQAKPMAKRKAKRKK